MKGIGHTILFLALASCPSMGTSQTADRSRCGSSLPPPPGDGSGQYLPPASGDTSGQYLPPEAGDTSGQYLPGSGPRGNSGERRPNSEASRPPLTGSRAGGVENPSRDRIQDCAAAGEGVLAARSFPAETQSGGDPVTTASSPSDPSVAPIRSNSTVAVQPPARDASLNPPTKLRTAPAISSQPRLQTAQYQLPVGPARISSGYFDSNYPPTENRQHLGIDMLAAVGTPVYAPVSGRVVTNMTSAADVMQAYLVIQGGDGVEHVLGHISSSLAVGANVKAGQQVGTIRSWPGQPGRSHVHWGMNRLGVAQAMTNGWGWGRAPVTASIPQATARGWVNP